MTATRSLTLAGLATAAAIGLFASCDRSGPGQLAVNLVDAPNPAVDQIVVKVTRVTAHSTSAGWVSVGPTPAPLAVDLLKLQTYVAQLGLVNLPAGTVTQVRLLLAQDGNYVVPSGSTAQQPLLVPSGFESGIKITGPWDVPACTRLTVTLDFDGKNSLEFHLADGTWILRPVIRPRADQTSIACAGQPCTSQAQCPEGQVCTAGTCTPAPPAHAGSPCTAGTQCLSGVCTAGTCAPGNAGAPCAAGGDCVSGTCTDGSCGSGSAGGAGASCTANAGCLSGNCSGGTCQPGGQGTPCTSSTDCQSAPTRLVCTMGVCQPAGP